MSLLSTSILAREAHRLKHRNQKKEKTFPKKGKIFFVRRRNYKTKEKTLENAIGKSENGRTQGECDTEAQ